MATQTGFLNHAPLAACKSFRVTAGVGGVTQGTMALIEDTVGVYMSTEDAGDYVGFMYESPWITVPCASGTYTAGEKVYFVAADAEVSTTAGTNALCGIVRKTEASAVETVEISLYGTMEIVA